MIVIDMQIPKSCGECAAYVEVHGEDHGARWTDRECAFGCIPFDEWAYRQGKRKWDGRHPNCILQDGSEINRLAEIGAMVEAWDAHPKHQIIFKTALGNNGEILEPLRSAFEKFKAEHQKGGVKVE